MRLRRWWTQALAASASTTIKAIASATPCSVANEAATNTAKRIIAVRKPIIGAPFRSSFRRHVVAEGECQPDLKTFVVGGKRRQRVRHTQACDCGAVERFRAGGIGGDELRNAAIAIDDELENGAAAQQAHARALRNDAAPVGAHDSQDACQVGPE